MKIPLHVLLVIGAALQPPIADPDPAPWTQHYVDSDGRGLFTPGCLEEWSDAEAGMCAYFVQRSDVDRCEDRWRMTELVAYNEVSPPGALIARLDMTPNTCDPSRTS